MEVPNNNSDNQTINYNYNNYNSANPLIGKGFLRSAIPSPSFENVNENTPLIDQNPSMLSVRSYTLLKAIGRVILFLSSVTFFITAMALGDKSSMSDNVILGIVCSFGIIFSLYPIISLVNFNICYSFRRLRRTMKVIVSPRGSIIATIVVLFIMAIVSLSLPVDEHFNFDNNNFTNYNNISNNNNNFNNKNNFNNIINSARWLRAQSYFGLIVFLFLLFITSKDRKEISWRIVWVGLLIQYLLALFVLKTQLGEQIFILMSEIISVYFSCSNDGFYFLFGVPPTSFAARVFPAIVYFCASTELLYYFGILQTVVSKFATFFMWFTGTSGAESVVAVASPYIGQGENALLVRPFVKDFTRSEIHQVMTSGFATTSGAVLVGYVALGVSARILVTAAVMSVPCSIVLSKIRYPETEIPRTIGEINLDYDRHSSSVFLAIGYGAKTGVKIVLLISALVISVLSLLSVINTIIGWFSHFFYLTITLEKSLSYLFYPISWLMGIEWSDIPVTSEILALKLVSNEFVAFLQLLSEESINARTRLIVTYSLCGFSNFASIGIQVGILGSIAPSRVQDFANLAMSAMLTGALSTTISAIIIGMLY